MKVLSIGFWCMGQYMGLLCLLYFETANLVLDFHVCMDELACYENLSLTIFSTLFAVLIVSLPIRGIRSRSKVPFALDLM